MKYGLQLTTGALQSDSDLPVLYAPPSPESSHLFPSATAIYDVLKTPGIHYPTSYQPVQLQRMEAASSG